ncbi:MAG: hypothetical protein P1V97_24235, partial [Planctomycetota bacterium]|nr:hypothetical protein [Planctomycetota bacterium]
MEEESRRENSLNSSAIDLRLLKHRELTAEIAGLSDKEVLDWISESDATVEGHGVLLCPQSHRKVFVKVLPLTRLDLVPEHRHSTANYYGLPSYYHYRLGSSGFGAWRELAAHQLTNDWVITGQCRQFPLLYGSRQIPFKNRIESDTLSMKPWGGHEAIQGRIQLVKEAPKALALFLEYFPQTLGGQVAERLICEDDAMSVIQETEAGLIEILSFLQKERFLHMDFHFGNVLTDGKSLFLGDLGLAMTPGFELDKEEETFHKKHRSFDQVTAITSLAHSIVVHYDRASAV